MKSSRSSFLRGMLPSLCAAAIAGLAFSWPAMAQDWPTKPVTIIVPYGPGAANDQVARTLARILQEKLGQPFVVENRPGAGGLTGATAVSRAEPDGYTLLQHNDVLSSAGATNQIGFDPVRDLAPIAMLTRSPLAVLVTATIGVNDMKGFLDYARANPESTFFGTGAAGGLRHLQNAYIGKLTDTNLKAVSYNAGAEIIRDLVAGRVQMHLGSTTSAAGQIQDGSVKVLAYTAAGAGADAPQAPTLKEVGIDYEVINWFGIFGPPALPAALRDRINAAINEATADPQFEPFLKQAQASPAPMSAEEFAAAFAKEAESFVQLIESTGIKPQ